ncbi:hypothetical protein S245_030178, partial [Arachis hypogaea]
VASSARLDTKGTKNHLWISRSPRVDEHEDVDDVDDLANEFSYGQGKSSNNAISHKGLSAAWNVANVTKGSTVVIFGLGTVGLSVAQGAKLRGASQIIGMDKNPQKCEKGAKISPKIDLNIVFSPSTILGSLFVIVFVVAIAKAFGFTEVVDPNSYQEPIAQRITDGGEDFSFECVGDTNMITTALQSCCDVILIVAKTLLGWGLTVTLGVPKVKPEMSAHYGLFLMGRTLKGSLFRGWKPKSDLPLLVEKYVNK